MVFLKKLIERSAFFVSAFLFLAFELLKISKKDWVTDFWTHAAVVRTLTATLYRPGNPIIKSDIPHAFYSPYSVLVALCARFFGADPVQALTAFACVNLFLFVLCFYLFCKSLFPKHHQPVAALGLLFVLLFWDSRPPFWSGFYHLPGFHYVLPYPSTLAMSLSLFVLSVLIRRGERRPLVFALLVLLTAVTFIIHPTTAVFLFLAMAGLHLGYFELSFLQATVKSALLIAPALLLCLMWPYYNVTALFGNPADFNNDSKELYVNVPMHLWPVALLLPSWFWMRGDRVYKFLGVSIVLMLAVYAGAYFIKAYGFSRLLSNVLMFTQLLFAYLCFCAVKEKKAIGYAQCLLIIVFFFIAFGGNMPAIKNMANVFLPEPSHKYDRYRFLKDAFSPTSVVMADSASNTYVPAYGPKIVATKYPLYWVADINERREAVRLFFAAGSSDSLRQAIVAKYNVNYILLDETNRELDSNTAAALANMGSAVYEGNRIRLIKCR